MHGPHLARRKEACRQHCAEGLLTVGLGFIKLVALAGERAVELESHTARFGGLLDGDGYWLTHAPRR